MSNPKIKYIIFIECGSTMASPINTGIQRVVRNIVNETENVSTELGADSCLVEFSNNTFLELKNTEPSQKITSNTKRRLGMLDAMLATVVPNRIYYGLRYRLNNWLKRSTRRSLGKDIYQILDSRQQNLKDQSEGTTHLPILLLLDSTWNTSMWAAVDRFRREGGHVCAVLYDLIPFAHPETVAEVTRLAHTQWWVEAPSHVDSVMCISQTVRDEFLVWQQNTKLTRTLLPENLGYFHLGAELKQSDPVINILSSGTPTYLVVGSLEPRKNHAYILDAFEQLWKQGYEINLAIVGAYGWDSADLISRIESHSQVGSRLFLIRDATDRDLASLYDRCAALIIASIAEGFGLPIIEASQRGAKIICSDIPVFREVAGEQAVYFDLKNSSSLANKVISNFESLPKTCAPPKEPAIKYLTWKESTFQLFEGLILLLKKQKGTH
jgi:O-antigen biosynthesis alpha-1,2-rhamnosyltransferase